MIARLFAFLAAVLVGVVGLAGAADAQTYPPRDRVIVVVEGDLVPGGPITVEAQTFQGGGNVSITIDGGTTTIPLGTTTALPSGLARLAAVVPLSTAPGTYTLTASGPAPNGQPITISTPIRIAALSVGSATVAGITVERSGGQGSRAPLARTGTSHSVPMTQLAVVAIVAGGLLVLAADRRRSRRVDSAATSASPAVRS